MSEVFKHPSDHKEESFWLEDPLILFTNYYIIPKKNMDLAERLNTLTRLLLLLYFISYITKIESSPTFFFHCTFAMILINYFRPDKN